MTETEIANLALSFLGSKLQTSDVDTETTKEAITCRKWFDAARDEALISHPWNFAAKRHRAETVWTTITSAADNGSGLIRIGKSSHGLSTGNRVSIKDVGGVPNAFGDFYVTVISTSLFDLQDSTFSGTYTSGGSFTLIPLFSWSRQFTLPADWLSVRTVNGYDGNEEDSVPYEIEGSTLMMDEEILELKYTAQITDTTLWPQNFTNAFAMLLASYIAQDLTGPAGRAMELRQMFEARIAPLAKSKDSRQGKGRTRDPDCNSRVVAARRGHGGFSSFNEL